MENAPDKGQKTRHLKRRELFSLNLRRGVFDRKRFERIETKKGFFLVFKFLRELLLLFFVLVFELFFQKTSAFAARFWLISIHAKRFCDGSLIDFKSQNDPNLAERLQQNEQAERYGKGDFQRRTEILLRS